MPTPPKIGDIIHVPAAVTPATFQCVAGIVTTAVGEYRLGSLPTFRGFEFTVFAPHGSAFDAARRGAPVALDSKGWHHKDACTRT